MTPAPATPILGAVIVVYKDFDGTVAYVREQLPRLTVPWKAVVVDLAATPETTRRLAAACGGVLVGEEPAGAGTDAGLYFLSVRENLGYARGNNRGARFLLERFPALPWLLFSNSDIEILDGEVAQKLIRVLDDHSEAACAGPRILSADASEQLPFREPVPVLAVVRHHLAMAFGKGNSTWDRKYKLPPGTAESCPCAWVSGCFFLARASDFVAVGMFDEATFLYWEEAILAERMEATGKGFWYEPAATIRHLSGQTTARHLRVPALVAADLASCCHYYRSYRRIPRWQLGLLRGSGLLRLARARFSAARHRLGRRTEGER